MTARCALTWVAAVVALDVSAVVSVMDFGARGDGVTDDTAAIQRGIDHLAACGGGKLFFPFTTNGYLIASPAREVAGNGRLVRAQLVIPPGFGHNIQLEGEMPCKLLYSYQVRPVGHAIGGGTRFGKMSRCNTMLHSTWDAPAVTNETERPYAVIAAPEGDSCAGRFSAAMFSIKNLEIRVHLDRGRMYPTTSAAFLKNVSRLVIEDSQFCLDENVGDAVLGKWLLPNPCHVVGLHMSGDQNDEQIVRNVAVQGFRYGIVLGEHVVADHIYAHNCEEAVVFHDATHLSRIGMLVAQHNRIILSTTRGELFGNHCATVNVKIDLVNFEGGQTTGLPPFVSHLKYGIYDPSDRLRGSVVWHEPWGAGEFPVEGARNFVVRRFGEE